MRGPISDSRLAQIIAGASDDSEVRDLALECRTFRDIANLGGAKGEVDLTTAAHVEIQVNSQGKLWVNVDNICKLRIGEVGSITADMDGFAHYSEFHN